MFMLRRAAVQETLNYPDGSILPVLVDPWWTLPLLRTAVPMPYSV